MSRFIITLSAFLNLSVVLAGNDLKALLTKAESAASDTAKIAALLDLANHYRYCNLDSARYFLDKVESSSELHKNEFLSAKFHNLKGVYYLYTGDFEKSVANMSRAIESYKTQKRDDQKLGNSYSNMGLIYDNWGKSDSAIAYFNLAVKEFERINDSMSVADLHNNIATTLGYMGMYDSATVFYNKALEFHSMHPEYAEYMADVYTNVGIMLLHQAKYSKAFEHFKKSERIYDSLRIDYKLAVDYDLIASLYMAQGLYKDELMFRLKSYNLVAGTGNLVSIARKYVNIANVYDNLEKFDSAMVYYEKAGDSYVQMDNPTGLGFVYHNIGVMFVKQEDMEKGYENLQKAVSIRRKLGSPESLALSLVALGELAYKMKLIGDAEKYLQEAYEIGVGIENKDIVNDSEYSLSEVYFHLGRYRAAYELLHHGYRLNDTLVGIEQQRIIQEMQIKYDTEKKEQQLALQDAEIIRKNEHIARQMAESEKKAAQRNLFIVGFSLMLILAVIIFRSYRQKRKANILLASQNEEIRKQKEEIETQRDEIEAQRDHIQKQKEIVEVQKEEIEESIRYAKRIQNAVLPHFEKLFGNMAHIQPEQEHQGMLACIEYFLIFRPKDVVSGDFYWGTRVSDWFILAVADCTGHGVPGAFMSMLGISFLNEIVRKKEVVNAAMVLNHLRDSIIDALKQSVQLDEAPDQDFATDVKDGLDISLAAINSKTNLCQWAGANNPLWIVHNTGNHVDTHGCVYQQNNVNQTNHTDSPPQITEIKADKMPVAIHPEMRPFANYEFTLSENDIIYLFSDGYTDQFGGPKGKKYKNKKFKELLIATSSLSMPEQKITIETELDNWMAGADLRYEQVDDITVMGIKMEKRIR
ncbi:MAG: tetratricopeptide repeat protein [Bacteroidetes bacterium]|nr:tetratricopeptide repeat protein [Bacteroidota bacterium]